LEGSWLRNAKLASQVLQVIDINLEKSNVLVLVQLVGTIPDQYVAFKGAVTDLLCERRSNVLGLSAVGRVEVHNDDWVLLQGVLEALLAKPTSAIGR
jgi:hypothetical protein